MSKTQIQTVKKIIQDLEQRKRETRRNELNELNRNIRNYHQAQRGVDGLGQISFTSPIVLAGAACLGLFLMLRKRRR